MKTLVESYLRPQILYISGLKHRILTLIRPRAKDRPKPLDIRIGNDTHKRTAYTGPGNTRVTRSLAALYPIFFTR
jgi:hypothetical protein